MKLVRKNDEFIVIESNGSYHKVLLSEIDELIVLLCEAKQIDSAKANKSVGENLFAEQERVTKLFTPHVEALQRDYERVRAVMGMPLEEIKEKITAHRQMSEDDDGSMFGQNYFGIPDDLLPDHNFDAHQWIPPLAGNASGSKLVMTGRPALSTTFTEMASVLAVALPDCLIAADPSTKPGDMTMNIVKGREKMLVDLESGHDYGPEFAIPLEQAGINVNFALPEIPEKYLRSNFAKDKKDN